MSQLLSNKKTNNRLGREPISSEEGAWRLLTFMIFVFAVFLLSYFGLVFGYKNFVLAQINDKDKEIAELAAEVPEEQQDEFLQFQFQLINLQNILNNHILSSKFFPMLEANTNNEVSFVNLDLNIEESKVDIEAIASSYEVLSIQLAAFERIPEVLSFKINSAKIIENSRIQFDISLSLAPELFK